MSTIDNDIVVSICMITYNHEKYIAEALDSILMQKVNFRYEIVVGEDCSTDNTRQILLKYKDKYPDKFKLLLADRNVGMMANWIATLEACKGAYIAILEGDDYWTDPTKLQIQVDFLEENPEYVITYSDIKAFDSSGYLEKNYGGVVRDLNAEELQKCPSISTLTTCFRNVIKKFPQEAQSSRFGDLFTWSLLGHHGKGKFLKNIKPSCYRVHEGGVFSQKKINVRQKMWFITSGALYAYYSRIGNKELANYFHEKNLSTSIRIYGLYPLLKIFIKPILRFIKMMENK